MVLVWVNKFKSEYVFKVLDFSLFSFSDYSTSA